eukprot:4935520-Pleurochrysis_carterae.AAC.1
MPVLAATVAASTVLGTPLRRKRVGFFGTLWVTLLCRSVGLAGLVDGGLNEEGPAGIRVVIAVNFSRLELAQHIADGDESRAELARRTRKGNLHVEQCACALTNATYDMRQFLSHHAVGKALVRRQRTIEAIQFMIE